MATAAIQADCMSIRRLLTLMLAQDVHASRTVAGLALS